MVLNRLESLVLRGISTLRGEKAGNVRLGRGVEGRTLSAANPSPMRHPDSDPADPARAGGAGRPQGTTGRLRSRTRTLGAGQAAYTRRPALRITPTSASTRLFAGRSTAGKAWRTSTRRSAGR